MTVARLSAAAFALLLCPTAFASPELVRSKNCVACHSAERKMIGPSFKDIAAKYANDASAPKALAEKVRKGTVGAWGQMPMPPQPTVSAEEADTLVKWILTHK